MLRGLLSIFLPSGFGCVGFILIEPWIFPRDEKRGHRF